MHRLGRLINEHEDWLIERVVRYAHDNEYTRYTSTLREAWRSSIIGLSQPLVAAIDEVLADGHPAGAPIRAAVAFGVEQAQKHRVRGIDMGLFLGLMKFYRRAYFDLVEEKVPDLKDQKRLTSVLLEMFDSIEIGLVREWSGTHEAAELDHLREKNRELSNEKNKYLTVFESIAEPTILLDLDDNPLYVNAAGGQILLGETSPGVSYYGHPDTDRLQQIVAEILRQAGCDDARNDQISLDTAIGPRTFSIAIQEMLDISDKFAGRVVILKDVTDYLAAIAAAEDANRAKSSFLATVSHEIKTPINSIIGLTELLDDGRLTEEDQRHVDAIRASGKLLSELVENILGLSRSEANALRRNNQDFDLNDLIEGIMQVIRPGADARGLTAVVDFQADKPCRVHGDAQKVRHVLMNLLSNALKYTAEGGVTLRVTPQAETASDRLVFSFAVEDTGVGLPDGSTDWLFDPFTQYAHPDLESGPRGTGLGLAICKRLVSFLGGEISARPRLEGGSVFAFELPFTASVSKLATTSPGTSLEILVVEDDPVNALVAEGYVTDLGHKAVVVHDYATALETLRASRFDLVLTDNRLGRKTGLDLARYLRNAEDSRLNALPIVLVTAELPYVDEDISETVQHFIEKPYDRQDLAQAIRLAINAGDPASAAVATTVHDQTETHDPAPPLLDTRVLNQLLTDLGVERCWRIVESYQKTAPRLFRALAQGSTADDLVAISEAAHQLISAASFVGLTGIATRARELHRCCIARDKKQVRKLNADLQHLGQPGLEALAEHWTRATESYNLPSRHSDPSGKPGQGKGLAAS